MALPFQLEILPGFFLADQLTLQSGFMAKEQIRLVICTCPFEDIFDTIRHRIDFTNTDTGPDKVLNELLFIFLHPYDSPGCYAENLEYYQFLQYYTSKFNSFLDDLRMKFECSISLAKAENLLTLSELNIANLLNSLNLLDNNIFLNVDKDDLSNHDHSCENQSNINKRLIILINLFNLIKHTYTVFGTVILSKNISFKHLSLKNNLIKDDIQFYDSYLWLLASTCYLIQALKTDKENSISYLTLTDYIVSRKFSIIELSCNEIYFDKFIREICSFERNFLNYEYFTSTKLEHIKNIHNRHKRRITFINNKAFSGENKTDFWNNSYNSGANNKKHKIDNFDLILEESVSEKKNKVQ
ncbi:uncharacterized protein ASCRUDRAFT_73018 [Ascoidea rubescens DSM 1968]|uniref:Uncharacterized protein n=1 Tax=Ascoidea rubescens DSM 1968 TaxID=1344418 RepID=A0A1D2V8X5_9ASCO|nr:hypothetical protein ASCRUDRAFT_73018 [Ascoidea rubescens DSM 1968]ODV57955.1 hypothetical protein ASCRUDRAFT_73018 [Ascoidea rubescens DSM 1968]